MGSPSRRVRGERSWWCRTGSAVSTRPGGRGRRSDNSLVLLVQFSQTLCALSQAHHMRGVSTSALGHFGAARRMKDVWTGLLYPLGVTDYYGIMLSIPDLA